MIPNVQLLKNQGTCYRAENTVGHISVASMRAKNNDVSSAELIFMILDTAFGDYEIVIYRVLATMM